MAVSTKDQERLNGAQQSAVQNYTDQYYEAKARGDKAGMQAAHDAAERVRNQAGYSGGADGSAGSAPSRTAAEMERDVQQFNDVNYDSTQGRWTNGYTTEHNVRTKANAIRQQMLQNSQNWHTAGTQAERDYLHQQNLELNRILSQYAGGVESRYDPATGRWTTENADLGYGDIDPYDRANAKRLYGVTDAELDAYLRNTDRYFNYAQQHPLSYLGRNGAENQGSGSGGYGYGSAYGSGGSNSGGYGYGGYGSGGYGSGGYGYGGYGSGELSGLLGDWRSAAQAQAERQIDYATAQGVAALERAREDAAAQYQTQRDQAAKYGRNAMDNAALYAELRGDRGGIGLAQYNAVQNAAEENRLAVDAAQVKMATDTDRQIEDLRTQGEFAKANQVLEISQAYLQQLLSLERWAAEYNLSAAKFQETVRQWENEFALSVGQVTGSYQGQTTMTAKKYSDSLLAESGSALLSAGVMPNGEQLAAMGLTQAQARSLLGR